MAASKGPGAFTRTGQYLIYLIFRSAEFLLSLTPLEVCARLGSMAGTLAYLFFPNYRKLAINNLTIAFGREQNAEWIRQTARRHFRSLGSNFLCSLKLPLMQQEEILKRVKVEGLEYPYAVAAQGKSILHAVCHLGCWELLTNAPAMLVPGLKFASIFQALGNPYLNAHVKLRRERLGVTLLDRADGFGAPMKLLRTERSMLGILVDQHAGDKGVWCPFFDRLASTSNLIALTSIRCDIPIIPIGVYNDGDALTRWRVVCFPPINSGEVKQTPEGLTAMLNIGVEYMVRQSPHNWFWVHNRWKTPKPDFLLSQYRRGVTYPKGYDTRRLQPFRLLVRSPNWLGDACMAFPAVRALKAGRPDLHLTILCPAKLADLWRSLPEVDAIITKESKEGLFRVAKTVRESGPYDAAILLTNSTRSTLELYLAKIPRLVGYKGSLRSRLLNQETREPKRPLGPPRHHAERYLYLAENCGAKVPTLEDVELPPPAPSSNIIAICAGAEYGPAKRWPADRFAEVAKRLSARWPQVRWILLGAPGEKKLGEELSGMMAGTPHENLIGKTTLPELIAHLRASRLLVTNDTGTMHLAASLGVPTVSIFGSTEPVLTGPLGKNNTIVRHHVPCSPCFKRECPFGHYDCMTGITPEIVEKAVMEAVQKIHVPLMPVVGV